MVVSSRRRLTVLALALAWSPSSALLADDAPPDEPAPEQAASRRALEDPPAPFVPLRPRSEDDRRRIEATRLYAAARAMEDRGQLVESLGLLEQARQKDPDSVAILRRLSRVYRGLGRIEESVDVARKILERDPGDTAAIWLLVAYALEIKKDPAAAANELRTLLERPDLPPDSAGALLARRTLGDLSAEFLGRMDEAADAYEAVLEALDRRSAARIPPSELRRILRDDEAESYLRFGEVFLREKRYDLAIRAFRHGLRVDSEDSQIPRFLAEALLRAGRLPEALETLEGYLRRQPQGREPYELLAEILAGLGREREILPRLVAASEADPENLSLQFALVERYREEGRAEEADARLAELLKRRGDPQIFGPLSASLLKERKTDELVKVLRDAFAKPGGPEAVAPQAKAIVDEPEYADEVLEAAIRLFEAEPDAFGEPVQKSFAAIARLAGKPERLLSLDRLVIRHDPSPQHYRELVVDLFNNARYDEAADSLGELLEKYPAEKTAQIYRMLAQCLYLSGRVEPGLEAAREAEKLEPDDPQTLLLLGALLSRAERHRDAIAHYENLLARFPNDEEMERRARLGLSSTYVSLEDFEKGEAELELLLEKYPDDPGVNNDLGYLYADRGVHLERAEAMIRKALEDEPENSSYLDSLGWVLYRLGRYEEAIGPLEKAAEDRGADTTIHDHLGDVYYRLRRYDAAREAWTRAESHAAQGDPPDRRLATIRQKLRELERLMSSRPPSDGRAP